MALPLIPRIEEATERLAKLGAKYQALLNRVEQLEEKNADLSAENERLERKLVHAQTDIEFLTMSHRLADDPESLLAARRKVAAMIRDIDRCISQLKE